MHLSIALLCVSIGLLASPVASVSVTVEKSLVRTEAKARVVDLGSKEFDINSLQRVTVSKDKPSQEENSGISTCDLDYPLGPDHCSCTDPDDTTRTNSFILDGEECLEAARQAQVSAPAPISYWRLSSADDYWQVRYPRGCFVLQPTTDNPTGCAHDPKGVCYFFNEIGTQPPYCTSTAMSDGTIPNMTEGAKPVCKRAKYLYGTTNTNGQGTDCPLGYSLLNAQSGCLTASECQGYRTDCDAQFVIDSTNQSEYNIHPLGCFEAPHKNASRVNASSTDNCVYFNQRLPDAATGKAYPLPPNPKGKPICLVTYPQNYTSLTAVNFQSDGTTPLVVRQLDGATDDGTGSTVVTNSASNGIGSHVSGVDHTTGTSVR